MAGAAVTTKTPESTVSREWPGSMFPLSRFFSSFGVPAEAWIPTMDIQQSNGTLIVSAELPGLKKEDIRIEASNDALVIEGERKQEQKEDQQGFYRYERSYGRFYRWIPLPEGAKPDQAKAELADGVLKISVPVPASKTKTRQIEISSQERDSR